jgi:PBP1b-binding outer membrane lipoprotein LpoB
MKRIALILAVAVVTGACQQAPPPPPPPKPKPKVIKVYTPDDHGIRPIAQPDTYTR